jgi:mRNA-degrading endonuclease RelE of RelBE toxin-antitoxin system
MTFEINIKGKSLKFISSLQKHDRERLKEAILVLKEDPVPIKSLDITKLKGEKISIAYVKGNCL